MQDGRCSRLCRDRLRGLVVPTFRRPGGVTAQKDVADVAVVAAVDGGVTGYLGAVRHVVRGGSLEDGFEEDCSANEIVDERAALAEYLQRGRGREDVVLDQIGAVTHLHKKVAIVVVEEIPRHAGALRLPVQPDSQRAVVDAVVADDHVDRGMELDAGDLISVELPLEGIL